MTKIDERISLELEQDLKALFGEDVACEVDAHDEQPYFHEGGGEWYVTYRDCVHCGRDSGVSLICAKFKSIIEGAILTGTVPCSMCKVRNKLSDIVVGFTRRS